METQTQARNDTQKENAKDRFVRKTRELFARESDLDKRWTALRPILAELLADPEMIEASKKWPDCAPSDGRAENLLFYEDPDFGFAINGLTKGTARQGGSTRVHDHAHIEPLLLLLLEQIGDEQPGFVGVEDQRLHAHRPLGVAERCDAGRERLLAVVEDRALRLAYGVHSRAAHLRAAGPARIVGQRIGEGDASQQHDRKECAHQHR